MQAENDIIAIIESLLAALKRNDRDTIKRIKGYLDNQKTNKSETKPSKFSKDNRDQINGDALRKQFSNYENRDTLIAHLKESYPAKSDISPILRSLYIPISKSDQYDAMIEKVVDITLGYKLRSQAIRGTTETD